MSANQAVKRNISGMQVIKTLQLLIEDNYTMSELTKKLNENEKTPIFNNSVVSKYINTCRYMGIDIPKIHNKYFVAKLPFGLDLSIKDIELLENLQKIATEKLSSKPNKLFNSFIRRLNKYSNKDITKVEKKTVDATYELFDKAIQEKRRIMLMFRAKALLECIPVAIVEYKGKQCFKVIHKGKERHISIERISGMELLGKIFSAEEHSGQRVEYILTGELAQRYTLRDHEELLKSELPNYIKIANKGEDKFELFSRLLRYDKDCEIIKPQSYRDEMKVLLDNMLANYGE